MRKTTYLVISSSLIFQLMPATVALAAFHTALQPKRGETKEELQQKRDTFKQEVQQKRDNLKDELQQKKEAIKEGVQEKVEGFRSEVREKRETVKQELKAKQETFRAEIKDKRETLRTELKEKREKFVSEVKERREELKKKLGEKRAENIERFFENMLKKFENALERLKNFADRITERLNKAEENGKNVSEIRAKLTAANEKILEAEKALEDAKIKYSEAVKESDLKTAFQKVRKIVSGVTEKVKVAHRALVEVITSFKGLSGGRVDQNNEIQETKERNVEITSAGFAPSELKVKVGTTVHFTNRDSQPHWPASGVHPTHELCPGFDSLKGLAKDESYSFTFNEAKICPMHDHLNPTIKGKIEVE